MKSKWHIPLSSRDPGYQLELARCKFFNKRWDELTDEEKAKKDIPSLWDQVYSRTAQMKPGAIVIRRRDGRASVYEIPFPKGTAEYARAMGACRFFRKKWTDLTEEEQQWNPVIRDKTTQEVREQKVGYNQPTVSGDTTGKAGCFIGPDGIINGGKPKIDGMVFDSRLQKVKKNCEDLCWVTDLVTTLVKSQARQVEIIKTMNDSQVTLENSIKSNTRAIEEQTTAIKDLTMTLKNFRGV